VIEEKPKAVVLDFDVNDDQGATIRDQKMKKFEEFRQRREKQEELRKNKVKQQRELSRGSRGEEPVPMTE
jgi:hypothetical protein